MSRETLLGYVILFVGVVVGWALCWLWRSVRERRHKPVNLVIDYSGDYHNKDSCQIYGLSKKEK